VKSLPQTSKKPVDRLRFNISQIPHFSPLRLHTRGEKVYFLNWSFSTLIDLRKSTSIHSGNAMKAKFVLQLLLVLILALFLGGSLASIYSNLHLKQKLAEQHLQLKQLQMLQQELPVDSDKLKHDSVSGAITVLQSELLLGNLTCRAILIKGTWFIILLTACGFAATHKMYYHIQSTLLKPIDRIDTVLSELLTDEIQLRRISVSRDTMLFQLAETCNLMLDNWQREKDHHQQVFRMLQKTAVQLIEIFEEPTIAITGSQELALANNNAKDFFIGEGGQRFFLFLTEAIKQGQSEFTSHGLRYTIKTQPQPKHKPDLLVTIYQFQCAGKMEQEKMT
jgi:hypothetical protein